MAEEVHDSTTAEFEHALANAQEGEYVLHLYIAGTNQRSLHAVQRITDFCERFLAGRYELKVIDIYQHPALAEAGQVIAAPTLVRSLPEPMRRVVGDMADEGRVMIAMGIRRE